MPTLPDLSSKIVVSPMKELLLVKPIHFVILPNVPPPVTGRFGPIDVAAILMLNRVGDALVDPPALGIEFRTAPVSRCLLRADCASNSVKRNSGLATLPATSSAVDAGD